MSYSSEVLADSPLAYWRLGDAIGSGATVAESSGNGRIGSYGGTVLLGQSGALTDGDTAIGVNGPSGRANIDAAPWMNVATWTVEAWIKVPANLSGGARFVTREPHAGTVAGGYVWSLQTTGSGGTFQNRLVPVVFVSGTAKIYYSNAVVADNTWHHVAVTWDGTTIRMYVDGAASGTGTPGGAIVRSDTTDITIGNARALSTSGNDFTYGKVGTYFDEVAFYSGALSAARIAAHYAAAVPPATITGTLAATLPAFTAELAGTSTSTDPVTGSLDANLPAFTAALTGGSSAAVVTGSLAATIPAPFGELAGEVPVTGSLAAALPSLTGSLTGIVAAPGAIAGVLGATIPALSAAFTGDIPAIASAATDTNNRANGRSRSGKGWANLSEPVTPTPPGIDVEPVRVMAQTLPVPVLSQGRPT